MSSKKDKLAFLPPSENYSVEQAISSALQYAEGVNIQEVLIIGTDAEGELFVRSSKMDRKSALWLLERAKIHALYED